MLHDPLAQLEIPLSTDPGGLLVGRHARLIEEYHPELDPTLPNKAEQALPDASACPADEDLGRPPLDFVLMPPEDR